MEINFVGGAYTGRSKNLNAQVCQNYYPVLDKQGGKKVIALMGTPGLLEVHDFSLSYRVRGQFWDSKNNELYVAVGDKLFKVDPAYSETAMTGDDLGTTTGKVWMESNGTEIMVIDGVKGYIITIATGVCAEITDADFPTPSSLAFQDGYFIVTKAGTDEIYISALYDGTNWAALDYAAAEGAPDTACCVYSNRRNVWIPGVKTTEVFYNSGDVDFPFERVAGAVLNVGIRSPAGITSLGDTVYWLDHNGQPRRSVGYESQVISTPQIDFKIASMSDISDCECYAGVLEGEESVIFQFPTADETLVYSPTSGFWHTRATGAFDTRHPIGSYALFGDDRVVGHISNGKLYKYDLDTFTDCGEVFNAIRAAQAVHAKRRRVFHDELEIEFEITKAGAGSGTFYITQSADDYRWGSGWFQFNQPSWWLGNRGPTSYASNNGGVFNNITIPQGSIITTAYLKLMGHGAINNNDCNVNIYFENADAGVAATSEAEGNALVLTNAIAWSEIEAFTYGEWYNSPELKTILQTIIDRSGFASGNDIQVVIKDNSSTENAYRDARAWDFSSGVNAVELHIEWTIGECSLIYSDDHGNTWSTAQKRDISSLTDYEKRVIWQKLGSSRQRIYKVTVSNAVKRIILGANLKASIGRY